MKQQQTAITSLPPSPADERKARMIKYTIASAIRMACIILAVVIHGWISIPFIVGAIVLPYFAVIGANVSSRAGVDVISPDDRALQRYVPTTPFPGAPSPAYGAGAWNVADGTWNAADGTWRDADTAWRTQQAEGGPGAPTTAPAESDGTERQ